MSISNQLKRFNRYIKKDSTCLVWVGAKDKNGYGLFTDYSYHVVRAHRFIYKIKIADPKDKFVCHKCDNPSCVKISHLFLGSCHENLLDCKKKGRNSHKLSNQEISQMRYLFKNGVSQISLSKKYKIVPHYVSMLVNNKRRLS